MHATNRFARVIVRNSAGSILTVTHVDSPGTCNFPGGKIERGESPEAAARREVFEETGITVGALQLVCAGIYPLADEVWEGFFFAAESYRGEPRNGEPEKLSDVGFHESGWVRQVGSTVFVTNILDSMEVICGNSLNYDAALSCAARPE